MEQRLELKMKESVKEGIKESMQEVVDNTLTAAMSKMTDVVNELIKTNHSVVSQQSTLHALEHENKALNYWVQKLEKEHDKLKNKLGRDRKQRTRKLRNHQRHYGNNQRRHKLLDGKGLQRTVKNYRCKIGMGANEAGQRNGHNKMLTNWLTTSWQDTSHLNQSFNTNKTWTMYLAIKNSYARVST